MTDYIAGYVTIPKHIYDYHNATAMNNNDQLISDHVPDKGFFLEIGCWDGVHISQTYALEKKGWKGICVDPIPKNFEGRKCELVKRAVSSVANTTTFILVTTDRRHGGDVSYFSGLKDCIAQNETIRNIIYDYCEYEEIELETMPVSSLLAMCPKRIDFLSIDTEGSEVDILSAIDFNAYDIGCIMVEHNQVDKNKLLIMSILSSNGYYLAAQTDIDYLFKKVQ